MKLRIKGNALRVRLTQGEVRTFATTGLAEERTEFPGGTALRYRVRQVEGNEEISVRYDGNLIEVQVPKVLAERWCGTDLVTLRASLALPSGSVQVVLEKDFACLVPREGEDESDHFAHPQAGAGHRRC
jgi:hypothetical protein